MNKIFTFLFFIITSQVFSQTDLNGNPVFNSISTTEETVKDFQLISNYYTLINNIENKNSSVYISNKPTLDEIENAAINLPSDFFIITKKQKTLNMVLILNKPTRQFFVINPTTGKQKQFPCSIKGDITENRANEIIKEKFDPKSEIKGSNLYFNNKTLAIVSNKKIKENILKLIDREKLNSEDSSNTKILSKEDLKKIILAESKEGGKLDFFSAIKGHDYDGIQIKPGVFSTKSGIALYQWGQANFELGTNTIEDALEFWAAFKGRQANEKEKDYIKMGFNKELQK